MLPHQKQLFEKRRRATLANSEGQRKRIEGVRTWKPIIVTGISFKERQLITPQNYSLLDVDPAYQRGETSEVPGIVAAIQEGGIIPDTPDLAERAWGPKDGKLWILDGLQRICALQQLNMPFYANVHTSEALESERMFFLAMNSRHKLNSNVTVKAYNGPVVVLLRTLNDRADSGVAGRIEFDRSGGDRLAAAVMVKGIERLLSRQRLTMKTDRVLSRTDGLLDTNEKKLKATMFCRLIATIFDGYAKTLPVLAFAEVAGGYWEKISRPDLPSPATIKRLRAINWAVEVPSMSMQFTDLAVHVIRKRWKPKARS